ncbi:MAG: sulfatase-like hydrolase/transferase [Lentisphaeria bacterium]|nr:sulfatase-like hydrolase/transferase [Lentisphaeria bacterium]
MSERKNDKLNVLFIISDQHKRSAMGVSGNTYVRTPNLDELAANGVIFSDAYCASPLCAPARAALITSTMPHRNSALFHAVTVNGTPLSPGYRRLPGYRPERVTIGEYFRKHGFRTGAIGKMHVHGETRENDMGFDERSLRIYTYDFEDYEKALAPDNPAVGHLMRLQYSGQESPASSAYVWPWHFNNRDPERCPVAIEDMPEGLLTEEKMFDVMTTAESIDFIKRHKDEPFFLHVGLEKPHPPWTEVKRFIDMYDPDDLPDEHLPHAWNEEKHDFYLSWQHQAGKVGIREIKMGLAAYYANVTSMDEKVGQLVACLKNAGIYDRTVIVYTSDHGELCYEHNTVQKHNMYEASVNVPLIVSCPSRLPSGVRTRCLASHIDLLPTLGELCGLPAEDRFQGKSLVPALMNPACDTLNTAVFSELCANGYAGHPDNVPDGPMAYVPSRMVRTREWKYIYTHKLADQLYPAGSGELFAEDNDASRRPDVVKTLKRWAVAGWDTDGFIKKHSDDPDLEDLLGNVHLQLSARRDENGIHLRWASSARIHSSVPDSTMIVDISVERFSIYRSASNDIVAAECVYTTPDASKREWRDIIGDDQNVRWYYWVIAETDTSTLGASNVATA